jgi:DNA-binding NarL/FixJ family response regulator
MHVAERPGTADHAAPQRIRVVVIEPRQLLGHGVQEILEQSPEFDVVAHVQSAVQAVPYLDKPPDVVLVDLDLPDPTGDATRRLHSAAPTSAFVVIGPDDDASIVGAVEFGAVALIGETAAPDELVETIRRVAEGEDPLKEELAARPDLIDRLIDDVRAAALGDAGPRLTARELEVLRLVAEGASNRDIAERFGLSESTVKNHLSSILHKLGVSNRTRAVFYASRQGWLDEVETPPRDRSGSEPQE